MTTTNDLLLALNGVTSPSDARALISRAMRITGVSNHRPLDRTELVQMCEALGAEGGPIQRVAESIAMAALRE
jgi:hypothetical protein